jgi:hypothetical protein
MTDTEQGSNAPNGLLEMLPTDKLAEVAQTLLTTMTNKAVEAAIDQVEALTGRLTDVAENGGHGLGSALSGGDGTGSVTGTLTSGLSSLTSGVGNTVKGALGMDTDKDSDDDTDSDTDSSGGGSGGSGGAGGSGKFKFMNITEQMDVGVPLRTAYDQWTQFADFPSFMKKVETVEQESDEKINWKAQVFWSHRSWESTIVEQIPDTHIVWRSTGAKGYADGHVSFHELAPRLTRILLVLEYYPQGFFEKTGNLWRAVGRRTRLEFKHFCRHLQMDTILTADEDLEGWRGEIRDSEVVTTHEEALEQEQAEADGSDDQAEGQVDDDEADDEVEDEDQADDQDEDEEVVDEAEDQVEDDVEDELGDEADDQADDQADDEADDVASTTDSGTSGRRSRQRPGTGRSSRSSTRSRRPAPA